LVKLAATEATSMQAVLFRSVFSAAPILAIMHLRQIPTTSNRIGLLVFRGTVGFIALSCYLWAITQVGLADVLALQQLSPMFVAFLSVLLLHERPRRVHYVLAGVCMIGALLVVQPTRGIASLPATMALLSALFSSGAYVAVRSLTRTEPTLRIVLWFSGVAALLSLPLVIPGWSMLSLRTSLLLIGCGLVAAVAQYLMTAAYRLAPAHIASAFSYTSVPIAYVAGLWFWQEQPNSWANLGIVIITLTGIVIVYSMRPPRHFVVPKVS